MSDSKLGYRSYRLRLLLPCSGHPCGRPNSAPSTRPRCVRLFSRVLSFKARGLDDKITDIQKALRAQIDGRQQPTLHPRAVELLGELRRQQIKNQVRGLEKGLVFPSTQGTYRYSSMLTVPLKRCAARVGIKKNVSTHTMRRSFNNIARQVAGQIVTQAMVGHTTDAMTAHYSTVSLDEKRAALKTALGDLG